MTLYLVRHGLAAAGVEDLDPGLDDVGHKQAAAAATALKKCGAGRLVVSPLRRTRETAVPIAAALALETEIRDEVAEVFDPSMPSDARRAMIGPFMSGNWSAQDQVLRDWRQRVVDALVDFGSGAAATVVVSHYIAICVAIGEAMPDDRVVPVPLANTSITTIEVEGGRLVLTDAGSTTHLSDDLVTGLGQAFPGMRRA